MRDLFDDVARDRLLAAKLIAERARRERHLPWWAISLGVSTILAGLAFTLTMLECFRDRH